MKIRVRSKSEIKLILKIQEYSNYSILKQDIMIGCCKASHVMSFNQSDCIFSDLSSYLTLIF